MRHARMLEPRVAAWTRKAVEDALAVCSPRYASHDVAQWRTKLSEGAELNGAISFPLGGCYEVHGERLVDRPDRYFGIPVANLLDCHWMIYRASREYYERRLKEASNG